MYNPMAASQELRGKFYLDGELVGEMDIVHFIDKEARINCICSQKYWEKLIADGEFLDMSGKDFNIDISIYLTDLFRIPWLPVITRVKQYYRFTQREMEYSDRPSNIQNDGRKIKGIMRLDIDKRYFKLKFPDESQYELYKKYRWIIGILEIIYWFKKKIKKLKGGMKNG